MKKRLLGILFSFALMMGMLPVLGVSQTAYADDTYNLWVGGTEVTSKKTSGPGWSFSPASAGAFCTPAVPGAVMNLEKMTGNRGSDAFVIRYSLSMVLSDAHRQPPPSGTVRQMVNGLPHDLGFMPCSCVS